MKSSNPIASQIDPGCDERGGEDCLLELVQGRTVTSGAQASFAGVVIGQLVAIRDESRTPLVVFPGQIGSAAVVARSVVELHGAHIGRSVVLAFDGGVNGARPIILGVLHGEELALEQRPAHVEVDADGEHLTVSARDRLVLRCGKASITLTKSGKVLIEGAYVSSRSSGVNRIKGGSIQLN